MQRRRFLLGLPLAALGGFVLSCVAASDVGAAEASGAAASVDIEQYRAAAVERWEREIARLAELDKTETHPDDSILFVGSSSVRLWDDIEADMAPYHPIQRGYGGAMWSDVAVFAERLITPHKFRAAVFFVGNDIRGRDDDKSPQEVAALCSYVRDVVKDHNPQAPVFFIAVTPTESRFAAWPAIKAANSQVREMCQRTENTYFIGTESIYVDADGRPRPELFRNDKLHLSRDGYIRWAAAIKSHLDTVLDGAMEK